MTSSIDAEDKVPGDIQVAALLGPEVWSQYYNWNKWAHPQQVEPEGDWTTWLFMGGRGCGKTRTGAEWVRGLAAKQVSPIALVGETMTEALAVMVRGPSGLFNVCRDDERPKLTGTTLVWPNGVEAMLMSGSDPDRFRGPQFAAAWCDELGCAAVDKGANQPNIFGDAKSVEGGRPYFSCGTPDPLIQRQALRAHQAFWREPGNNPAGMVDISRIYHWTWDARPYPAFPAQTEVWADGVNHRSGHWLTGRLGGMASDELAVALARDHGVALVAEPAAPMIGGYVLSTATSGREALEPVMEVTGLRLRSLAGGLELSSARRGDVLTLDPEQLVQGEGAVLSRRRPDPAEAPGRLVLSFLDRERDYQTGTVTALNGSAGPVAGEGTALVLDGSAARLAAERMLDARSARRETLEVELPPSALALEPGDLIEISGLAEGPFEITEIRDGLSRRVTARTLAVWTAVATEIDRAPLATGGATVRSIPVVTLAHLPALPSDPGRSRLVVGGYAEPWPGVLQLVEAATGLEVARLTGRARLGVVETALAAGPVGVWDSGPGFEISLHSGHLGSVEEAAVLAGSNRLAIETDAGGWEVIGFAQAELIAPERYRLRQLMRGLDGSLPGATSAGRRVMVLDSRVVSVSVESDWLGKTRNFRVYAGAGDLVGTELGVSLAALVSAPQAPVHLHARRVAGGNIELRWTRAGVLAPEHMPERYEVSIFDGGAVVRSFESNLPSVVYTHAEQVTDFGGPANSFTFTVAQISAVLGTGRTAEGAFYG